MNEYEAATLATRYAGLWIAAAQVGVGLLQAGIVWYGIRAMQCMGATRAREQDQRHEETMTKADQLHEEVMTKADQRHEEVMTKADQRHEEAMTALNELIRAGQAQTAALETVIERTAPEPPRA